VKTRLTKKQKDFIAALKVNWNDADQFGEYRGIELFTCCGNWKTACALEKKGLIEICRNSNRQTFCFLKEHFLLTYFQ
jgi:hypothetical protein